MTDTDITKHDQGSDQVGHPFQSCPSKFLHHCQFGHWSSPVEPWSLQLGPSLGPHPDTTRRMGTPSCCSVHRTTQQSPLPWHGVVRNQPSNSVGRTPTQSRSAGGLWVSPDPPGASHPRKLQRRRRFNAPIKEFGSRTTCWYHSTSRTSSNFFPTTKVTFQFPCQFPLSGVWWLGTRLSPAASVAVHWTFTFSHFWPTTQLPGSCRHATSFNHNKVENSSSAYVNP